jgi:hypothetical protein
LKVEGKLAREREVLLDAILVRFVHGSRAAEIAAALGVFGLRQVAFARAGAQNFSAGRNLEPLGHGLLRFNAFGTSHKSIFFYSKRARNICRLPVMRKRLFRVNGFNTAGFIGGFDIAVFTIVKNHPDITGGD